MKLKISIFFLSFVFSNLTHAQTPPNDSCAASLRISGEIYWVCESGIVVTSTKSKEKKSVMRDELKLPVSHLNVNREDFAEVKVMSKKVSHIPVESCPVGFTLGQKKFYKCNDGLYKSDGDQKLQINRDEWDEELKKFKDLLGDCKIE